MQVPVPVPVSACMQVPVCAGCTAPALRIEPWLSELSELSELSDCYRTAIGLDSQIATIGTIGHYRTLSDTIGAAQRSSAIGAIGAIGVLSELYRSMLW